MKQKTILFMTAACLCAGSAVAQEDAGMYYQDIELDPSLRPLEPTYLDGVYQSGGLDANWFLSVNAGTSAFCGKPVGHGDIFDRTEPLLSVSAGKWLTPHIGLRLSYQGLQLKDSDIKTRRYQNFHADFLYNTASFFQNQGDVLPRWNIIPYAGIGFIKNQHNGNKPFAVSYGILAKYRLTGRLYLSAGLGAATTWQDFDGHGDGDRLGDHLLQAGIGLDLTIGKVGCRRVIDPKPYIVQNDLLIEYLGKTLDENFRLSKLHVRDTRSIAEMRKILDIEGLLDKYNLDESTDSSVSRRNNYSGLNALRARLRNKGVNPVDTTALAPSKYFQVMKDGKIYVGAPIFFFFRIGTDELTEKAQILNIKEVARIVQQYGLSVKIVGAADSQTGTPEINNQLSVSRANYISKQLTKHGVPDDRIIKAHEGGIDTYKPMEGNRNTRVLLYFK